MGRGGRREGAGRPKGTGKFGEATKAIRLPISLIEQTLRFVKNKALIYPFFRQTSKNGDASVSNPDTATAVPDAVEKIDLAARLLTSPATTVVVRVDEKTMIEDGILPGDLLLVESDVPPRIGDIILADRDGRITLRRFAEDMPSGASAVRGVVKKIVRDYDNAQEPGV